MLVFFFQAEDGIRDLVRSRGLGDVYKRQALVIVAVAHATPDLTTLGINDNHWDSVRVPVKVLSLIHI